MVDFEMLNSELSPVQEFYTNKSIFITGASGFVGKTIVEKLLRSCESFNRVYLLLRHKRNESVKQRLENLLQNSIFDTLKKTNPHYREKLVVICGDASLPCLGISEEDQLILQKEVHIVFHCAAAIKFNETLSQAMKINFHGTEALLQLCLAMSNLCALVHVSTAFSNAERMEVDEIIYPFMSKSEIVQLIEDIKTNDKDELEKMTPMILRKKPNTYVFTKAVTENLLKQYEKSLPIAIVRPSIVTATANEPVPGWIDNYSALSGLLVFAGKGLLRSFNLSGNTLNDLIPVDYVANTIILAGWKKGLEWQNKTNTFPQITVYNCCCKNPITFNNFCRMFSPILYENPFDNVLWYPTVYVTNWSWIHWITDLIFQWLPAFCIDTFNHISLPEKKNTMKMVPVYKKVKSSLQAFNFFMTREWLFFKSNVLNLNNELAAKDQKLFPTFNQDINWPNYLYNYAIGLRKYALKEKDEDIPKAKRNIKQKYWIHNGLCLFLTLSGLYLLFVYAATLPSVYWIWNI